MRRILFAFCSAFCFFAVFALWDETPIAYTYDEETRVIAFQPGETVDILKIQVRDAYGILSSVGGNSFQIARANAVARVYVYYRDYRGGERCREFDISAADGLISSGEGFPVVLPDDC